MSFGFDFKEEVACFHDDAESSGGEFTDEERDARP
jgi:hypothetical protein